jgi:hypothetical protein
VFGGVDAAGTVRRTTFIYDPLNDQWSQGANMPTAREHLNAVTVGDAIYVIGGRNSFTSFNVNERYSPLTNQWQTMTPMPTARSATAAAALDNVVYVAGGEVPHLFDVNEAYDVTSDSWTRVAPMVLPRHGVAAVPLHDRILAPAGGTVQGLSPTDHVDAFVPAALPSLFTLYQALRASPCGG